MIAFRTGSFSQVDHLHDKQEESKQNWYPSYINNKLYFFDSFPKNEESRKIWLDVIPVSQKITKNSVVCSRHFKTEYFYTANSRQLLKADAIPSIFPTVSLLLVTETYLIMFIKILHLFYDKFSKYNLNY